MKLPFLPFSKPPVTKLDPLRHPYANRYATGPALHEDAVHLGGPADLQGLLLLRVVRVDEAQGPAVDRIRRNDDAEGLLIPTMCVVVWCPSSLIVVNSG